VCDCGKEREFYHPQVPASPDLQQRLEAKFGARTARIMASSMDRSTQEELLKEEDNEALKEAQ